MDAVTSQTLFFRVSSDRVMRELVLKLTGVFHVVPSAVPDADDADTSVLSVEVDGEHPELVDEVRALVAEADPQAAELDDHVDA